VPVTPGFYARLVREGNTFTGYFSEDGVEWLEEGTIDINMVDPVYVGLAVTSHDAGYYMTAEMSEYSATVGDITGDVTVAVVGSQAMPSNTAAGLYMTVEDGAGMAVSVAHPDPAATNIAATENWSLPLAAIADAGVDLTNVAKITVGAGTPEAPAAGSGEVTIGAISVGTPLSHNVVTDVTNPGDVVVGVPNDGVTTGGGDNGWPAGEAPNLCIDNDVNTKFLHFNGNVEPTGIQVTPAVGPTVVTGLTLTTANDAVERDPVFFQLYGSNDGIDGTYEMIAEGDVVDFAGADAWPRFTKNETEISFENDKAYTTYKLMFTAVRDAGSANSMQIAEIELMGVSSL
jgi:hypothetical protein